MGEFAAVFFSGIDSRREPARQWQADRSQSQSRTGLNVVQPAFEGTEPEEELQYPELLGEHSVAEGLSRYQAAAVEASLPLFIGTLRGNAEFCYRRRSFGRNAKNSRQNPACPTQTMRDSESAAAKDILTIIMGLPDGAIYGEPI